MARVQGISEVMRHHQLLALLDDGSKMLVLYGTQIYILHHLPFA